MTAAKTLLLANGKRLLMASGASFALDTVPAAENYNSAVNGNTAAYSFQSSAQARDGEVSFNQNYTGRIFARVADGVSAGEAIMFDFAPGSSFAIKAVSGLSQSTYSPTTIKTIASLSAITSGHTVVVGVSGFDIYVKDNGVEVFRIQYPWVCRSGYICTKEPLGNTRSAGTVTWLAVAALYSDPSAYVYDPRDFGMKSVATTGSISASSTSLVVADASNIAVGDHIIVEIGAEAGLGARGTVGVGGSWPTLTYANATAMNADSGEAANTFCFLLDTGVIYQYLSGTWTVHSTTVYYENKGVPRSLQARVTAKAGSTLTLDTAATKTATNANVYVACERYIHAFTYSIYYTFGTPAGDHTSFVPHTAQVLLPAGTWYTGGVISMGATTSGGNITLRGAGDTTILKSPKGVPCSSINMTGYSKTSLTAITGVSYLKQIGNVRDTGFGFNWQTSVVPYGGGASGQTWTTINGNGGALTETNAPQGEGTYPAGCMLTSCDYVNVSHITSQDVWRNAMGTSFCTYCAMSNGTLTMTDGLRAYIQWQYLMSDSSHCSETDVTITSPTMMGGFECFRSDDCTITRATGNNASLSCNSSGRFVYTDCTINSTIADGSLVETDFSGNNPLCGINSNIHPPASSMLDGGSIINLTINVTHRATATGDVLQGVSIGVDNPDITITGGSYSAPNYQASSSGYDGGNGVASSGAGTVVTGFTCVDNQAASPPLGKSRHEIAGGSFRRNIDLRGGTSATRASSQSGNTAREIYVNP